jgi:hypothetical protein
MTRYGDLVVCVDDRSRWYARVGRIVGKNKDHLGIVFLGDPDAPPTGRWLKKEAVRPVGEAAPSPSTPRIRAIQVDDSRVAQDFEILLDGEPHLILTGPNGSGKSSILGAIADAIGAIVDPAEPPTRAPGASVRLRFDQPLHEVVAHALQSPHSFVLVYLPPARRFVAPEVAGPKQLPWATLSETREVASLLLQHLVNERTRQSFAREDGDNEEADSIAAWFSRIEEQFRALTDRVDLSLEFERETFRFGFRLGRKAVDFAHLPDGFASLLSIWGEIALRQEAARREGTPEPGGFVVIDEIETHLHLRLQQRVLPLLAAWFPRFQFFVATHAPAVLSSVDNAMIFDLEPGQYKAVPSRDYLGREYGVLMTGHFGLSDDMDTETSQQLARFRELVLRGRTGDEEKELLELGRVLSERSDVLGLEVWRALEYPKRMATR